MEDTLIINMNNYFDFRNRFYLVTGASSGLGKTVSELLDECGARVLLTARNEERLKATREGLEGNNHLIYAKDLMDSDYTDVFDYAISEGGKIDGIVHCAGIAPIIPLPMLSRSRVDECMTSNFFSFVELMRLYSKKKYRAEKGSIVAVSAISSMYPDKCQTIYAASKAAVNAAVQCAALEFVKSNIRVNAVLPGSMNTEMTKKAIEEGRMENLDRKISRQILGFTDPEDIAKVVVFLLSDLAVSITGRTIFSDGGYINF